MNNKVDQFWSMMDADDQDVQDEGFKKWFEFVGEHTQYVDTFKDYLPKRFYEIYRKTNFHDFKIIDVSYFSKPPRMTWVKLLIYDYFEDYGKDLYYNLVYRDVKEFQLSVSTTANNITWGYDILELIDSSNILRHRIKFSDGASMNVVSKTINLIKAKPPSVAKK